MTPTAPNPMPITTDVESRSTRAAEHNRVHGATIGVEYALIGACLLSQSGLALALGMVKPQYFAEPLHQTLWRVMSVLAAEGRPATPVTVIKKAAQLPDGLAGNLPAHFLIEF